MKKLACWLGRCVALTGIFGMLAAGCALAQDYPNRPIRIVVPYGPGGVDVQVRSMSPTLSRLLGQQVVIENREGGGATVGTMAVRNAPSDGYTLLFTGTSVLSVVPHMRKGLGFSADDFAPIANVTSTPAVIAVRADTPYGSLRELIDYAKAHPGKVNMGSAGHGTSSHMAGESFQIAADIRFTHVPFKGVGAATVGVVGGHSDVVFGLPGIMLPHVSSGKLRIVASMGTERSEFFPDQPTLIEAGYKVTESTLFGFFVHRATPAAIQHKLTEAIATATREPSFVAAMKTSSASVLFMTPSQLRAAIDEQSAYWSEMLKHPRMAEMLLP